MHPDVEELIVSPAGEGTQEDMMKEDRFNGVPPVGDRSIKSYRFLGLEGKKAFLILVLLVFVVKIIIWGFYRYLTGSLPIFTDPNNGKEMTYWAGMIMKPILQLIPVVILWWFIFKERGSPFKFTTKNLVSSLGWGCIGGLIFFIVASFIYVAHMTIRGSIDFSLVAGWNAEGVGWGLVFATMFSYMIGTGPAEEIFSRGFLQDQTSRAYSVAFAIIFSAVLFAIGHIPVSIFLYHMHETKEGLITLGWYMVVLVIMGCFFSIIYHWSRNIVLGIIIHGLWDWYLTLFKVKGAHPLAMVEASSLTFGYIDAVNTLITLAIMLPIFYFLYVKFWKRDARENDSPNTIVTKIRRLDRGTLFKRRGSPFITTVVVCLAFCLLMIPIGFAFGETDEERLKDRRIDPLYEISFGEGIAADDGRMSEGNENKYEIDADDGLKGIYLIDFKLTWSDEPDQGGPRGFENQPDTFRAEITSPSGEVIQSGTADSDTGVISLKWEVEPEFALNGTFFLTIELVNAGDQEPRFGILPGNQDNDNEYSWDMTYGYVTYVEVEEKDLNIRW